MAKGKYRDKRDRAEQKRDKDMVWVFDKEDIKGRDPNEVTPAQLADKDFERQAAANAAGEEDEVFGFWGKVYNLMNRYEAHMPHASVNKRTYLILLVLLGWAGGHRYYERRWMLGLLYTVFCWTGLPLAMCVVDAMIIIPKKADENGRVTM
ncbi:MAG: NINE protein [Gemmiger sp.]|uniref:TM2 domain-containing protein n=1 Tax=Gemmiger sp. TaxID=2049027 RepID=UPI002E76100A|nr:NINE protein [Gemmiger sp.]MEE0801060.1 NINE protein [Gemmiger sp.]